MSVFACPSPVRHLIASDMNGRQRYIGFVMQPDDFIEYHVVKMVNAGQVHAEHIVGEVLCRPVMRGVGRVLQSEAAVACAPFVGLHRLDGGTGMAWGVELGNHLDAPIPSILDDLLVFLGRVKSGVADAAVDGGFQGLSFFEVPIGQGVAATEFGEFRQLFDLQAPRFIIGDMEMQGVHLP